MSEPREERVVKLEELIKVLKANINNPRRQGPCNPDAFLTKGEMSYLVEILEQHKQEESAK